MLPDGHLGGETGGPGAGGWRRPVRLLTFPRLWGGEAGSAGTLAYLCAAREAVLGPCFPRRVPSLSHGSK